MTAARGPTPPPAPGTPRSVTRRIWAAAVAAVAASFALAALVARTIDAPAQDAIDLVVMAATGSLVACICGALVLRRSRGATLRTRVLVIASIAIVATALGVVVAAQAMFISSHDLGALFIVLTASGGVAFGAALQLGHDIDAGTRQVRDLTEQIALGRHTPTADPPGATGLGPELDGLAADVGDLPRRLAELRRREDAMEQSRRELVSWVSHDLRAPLSTIRAMAEALDDGVVADPDTVDRYHHHIRGDAERLSRLVDDLFELSRIHSGTLSIRTQRVSLRDVVGDAMGGARARAEVKGVHLVDALGDLPAVDVSVPEVERVVTNLLDNAIRHTPPGGTVVVRSETDDRHASVLVADECGGIPSRDIDRVFDVAFRGDAARVRDDRGGGLGLAIAKGLVEACAGSIEVGNGQLGCCFTVRFPLPA